jgi:hypothetical protein
MNEEKFQILRQFDDDYSGCYTVYGKKVRNFVIALKILSIT